MFTENCRGIHISDYKGTKNLLGTEIFNSTSSVPIKISHLKKKYFD